MERLRRPAFAQRFHDELAGMVSETDGPTAVVTDEDAISKGDTDGADIVITIAKGLRVSHVSLSFARVGLEVRR
jgi:hypothetical protein